MFASLLLRSGSFPYGTQTHAHLESDSVAVGTSAPHSAVSERCRDPAVPIGLLLGSPSCRPWFRPPVSPLVHPLFRLQHSVAVLFPPAFHRCLKKKQNPFLSLLCSFGREGGQTRGRSAAVNGKRFFARVPCSLRRRRGGRRASFISLVHQPRSSRCLASGTVPAAHRELSQSARVC